ncbi:MAG TPA: iron-containing alcohol dehydrogenase [Gaiellaceae bacterium]|nr:iron-containing alcohol dehydrogenase [Gaiellaceae bacterium]
MIVRWGLEELPGLLGELGIERPFLVASARWPAPVEVAGTWTEVPSHRIQDAVAAAGGADGILAVGGGSAIDLAKAISVETGLPLVSVPTTYSGAEWTPSFGIRDHDKLMRGGGSGANLAGIVYEPKLTLDLPVRETVGTSLNALAHSAEALYVQGRNDEGDREALAGAALISQWLPKVVENGRDLEARRGLLEGAMHAGAALAAAGLGLGHAIAQALGGRYGHPHGAMNALALPAALRFNEPVAEAEIARFGAAMGTDDPIGRVEELARLGGFERLRDFGVPREALGEVAEVAAVRAGALANPRPASPHEIAGLLRSAW